MICSEEPAGALREAIKSGASNLKERLFIQLEPDKGANTQYLRKGHVQFDKYNFTSRLLESPTSSVPRSIRLSREKCPAQKR
mgnify:CR=1 FL=1